MEISQMRTFPGSYLCELLLAVQHENIQNWFLHATLASWVWLFPH